MEDGIGLAGPIEVGDDSAFFLPGFTEGIFQQASGIADGRHRNLLRSVEMAQSRIGKSGEQVASDLVTAANGQGTL